MSNLSKRGDIIVCISKDCDTLTYGRRYKVLMDQFGPDRMGVVDVMNDKGQRYMPASNYFVTLEEWREMRIEEITKPVNRLVLL